MERAINFTRLQQLSKRIPGQVLLIEDHTLVYQRDTDEETILVAARSGGITRISGPIQVSHCAIHDGTKFEEFFTHQSARVQDGSILLPAISPGVQVWITKSS